MPASRGNERIARPLSAEPTLLTEDLWRQLEVDITSDEELNLHVELVGTDDDVGLTASVAADEDVAIEALSRVGLFASLPHASLQALAATARQGEIERGAYLFREGDSAQSFFLVLDGSVEIVRRIEGRDRVQLQLHRGEAIGLLGLFSSDQRTADARAVGDALVLEVSSEALNRLVLHNPSLQEQVLSFYRERLLGSFLTTSPCFAELNAHEREQLCTRFEKRTIQEGETLTHPGEVGNQLVVLLEGSLLLEHRRMPGEPPHLYALYPSQFVAITSALSGEPVRMRLYASADSTVLTLPHRELAELLKAHPSLKSLASRMSSSARAVERDIFCGHAGIPGL